MIAPTSLPPAVDALQSGPIRRYPTSPDGGVPSGVAALGEARFLHRFESFAEQIHLGWLFGSSADKFPTYLSFDDAIVVVTPQEFTIIPWEEITEFLHPVGFRSSDGERYILTNDFTNYYPIFERMQSEVLTSVLPKALMAIEEGKEWIFEPFEVPSAGDSWGAGLLGSSNLEGTLSISTAGIRYRDQHIPWHDVASIYVTNHLYNGCLCSTTLSVRKNYGLFATLNFDFKTVPNSFLLTEMLPYVCPQRLLVAKDGG
ncbi:MAG TPA: hypothetical protein VMP01_27300 [Pirellulaceae bacterium]|nr:hypothetical protein [Pirellulaceae bacterium]